MSNTAEQFIETQGYLLFQEFCDACRRDGYIGLCHGTPGVGKTVSARYYANPKKIASSRPRSPADGKVEKGVANKTILYTPSVVNSPGKLARELGTCRSNFETALLRQLQKEEQPNLERQDQLLDDRLQAAGRGSAAAEERRGDAYRQYFTARKEYQSRRRVIRQTPMLLVIDEADRLTMGSLEQVRSIFDQGGMGVVLIGMPGIEKRLARYPQLYSRVGFVHEFCPLAETEVRGLLDQGWLPPGVQLPASALSDGQALAAILRIAEGNFRLLDRLLTQIARILTINNLQQVTPAVVEVARDSLVIGTD
jgi:DNA transposition AAA+ family ATPase